MLTQRTQRTLKNGVGGEIKYRTQTRLSTVGRGVVSHRTQKTMTNGWEVEIKQNTGKAEQY